MSQSINQGGWGQLLGWGRCQRLSSKQLCRLLSIRLLPLPPPLPCPCPPADFFIKLLLGDIRELKKLPVYIE